MTDRKEVERLAAALRAQGRTVEFALSPEGYVDNVRVTTATASRVYDPLSFAEWARPQVRKS